MNSQIVKLALLVSIFSLASCDITFKRKSSNEESAQSKMSMEKDKEEVKNNSKKSSSKAVLKINSSKIISSYYSNPVNAAIRKDMIAHTSVSKKQAKGLMVGKVISRNIQVMPLPLELKRILSPLPLHVIRVQVGIRVILMDVKTRQILEIIKI